MVGSLTHPHIHFHFVLSFLAARDFAGYVSSLPPAVWPHLEDKLDGDSSEVDTDLRGIAHHMTDWDSNLATHLELTEEDTREIRQEHSQPELQRCDSNVANSIIITNIPLLLVGKRRKKQRSLATCGSLLRVFVDAKHTRCAEALCAMLRMKCPPSISKSGFEHRS